MSNVITAARLRDVLVTAFEGGSLWMHVISRDGISRPFTADRCDGDDMRRYSRHPAWLLTSRGCSVTIGDVEGDNDFTRTLTLRHVRDGLELLRSRYPHHWEAIRQEQDDAYTADALLQCAAYGEIIFG